MSAKKSEQETKTGFTSVHEPTTGFTSVHKPGTGFSSVHAPDSLDELQSAITPPEVEIMLSTREDLKGAHWLSKLLGVSQGLKDTEDNKMYHALIDSAKEAEAEGGTFALLGAAKMREAAGLIIGGNVAFRVADFEHRPRIFLTGVLEAYAEKRMESVRTGKKQGRVTRQEYRKIISDAWNYKEEGMGAVQAYRGFTNPEVEVFCQDFEARHPAFRTAQSVEDAIANMSTAIIAEILIGKGVHAALKPAKAGFTKTSWLNKKLLKIMPDVKPYTTIDDMFEETANRIARDAGASDPIDGLIRALHNNPDDIAETYRAYKFIYDIPDIPGAQSIDDIVKGFHYRKWIEGNISKTTKKHILIKDPYTGKLVRQETSKFTKGVLTPKQFDALCEAAGYQDIIVPDMPKNILFHGSPDGVLDQPIVSWGIQSKPWKEGVGIYATDSLEQAHKYSYGRTAKGTRKAQAGRTGGITFLENKAKNVLDMDAPIDKKLWDEIAGQYELGEDYITRGIKEHTMNPKTNQAALMEIREAAFPDVGYDPIHHITDTLVDKGYDATKHVEGIKSGKPHNVLIFINEDAVKVIDAGSDKIPKVIRRTKKLNELSVNELEDMAREMAAIKDPPLKWRYGLVRAIREGTYGPPVNTFSQLGLERSFARTMGGIYDKNHRYNEAVRWLISKKREFKKRFNKSWGVRDIPDYAAGHIAADIPLDEWDTAVRAGTTQAEIDFLTEVVTDDRAIFLEKIADLAEEVGKISSDPAMIAAGIPPRLERYSHDIYQMTIDGMKRRDALARAKGLDIEVPAEYDLRSLLKDKNVPKEFHAGEFIARHGNRKNLDLSYTHFRNVGIRESYIDLLVEPEFNRMLAAIEALPADVDHSMLETAKNALARWKRQARNTPAQIDITLNQALSFPSRKMKKIFPDWEVKERQFERVAQFMSRRIDQGLLLGNPRPTIRNLFQSTFSADLYGNRNTLWGYQQLLTPGGRKLLKTSQVYLDRGVPLAVFDITDKHSWKQLSYLGIRLVDKYLNVSTSYLTGWKYYFQHNRRAWDELVEFAGKQGVREASLRRGSTFSGTLADAINAGMFVDARRQIDFRGIAFSQWMYDTASLAPMMNSTAGKLFFKYNTWQQYMWGAKMPQMVEQLRHGHDIFGMTASPSVRLAMFQMIAKGGLLFALGESVGISMEHLILTGSVPEGYALGVKLPFPVSPSVGLGLGIAATGSGLVHGTMRAIGTMSIGALTEDNRLLDAGIEQMIQAARAHAPFAAVGGQVLESMRGKQSYQQIFWPAGRRKKEEEPVHMPWSTGVRGIGRYTLPEK